MDQRRFHFHRAEPVSADVHDVVNAAQYPVVAIIVAPGCVSSEIRAGNA